MVRSIIALIACVGLLAGCSVQEKPSSVYHKISAEEAYQKMAELDDYVLLDVRTDEEYAEKHIDGAILIPDYEIEARAEAELSDKNITILIYCRSGRRSADAANKLLAMEYKNVYDFGGIIDWPYETVGDF